jgi:hypothetical protein
MNFIYCIHKFQTFAITTVYPENYLHTAANRISMKFRTCLINLA